MLVLVLDGGGIYRGHPKGKASRLVLGANSKPVDEELANPPPEAGRYRGQQRREEERDRPGDEVPQEGKL